MREKTKNLKHKKFKEPKQFPKNVREFGKCRERPRKFV